MSIAAYRRAALLAVAVLLPGMALAVDSSQYGPPTRERMPSSSRCLAECAAMEVRCEALEKLFPTCGTSDGCIEEKETCLAKCRFSATTSWPPRLEGALAFRRCRTPAAAPPLRNTA